MGSMFDSRLIIPISFALYDYSKKQTNYDIVSITENNDLAVLKFN